VVDEVVDAASLALIQQAIRRAAKEGKPVAVAGGRHAMGGQQFCAGGVLLDTRGLARVLDFDCDDGTIEVEAGIQWPELAAHLAAEQLGQEPQWGIAQKQTGADRLSIGGAIAANVHGRGLTMRPFVGDVESLVLVTPDGEARTCSREQNGELFRLVAGGYGLFGCVHSAKLRLLQRRVLERVVDVRPIDELMPLFEERIRDGFLYGDFQFASDERSDDFMRRGVFSCYRPLEHSGPLPTDQRALSQADWQRLLYLAHTDKSEAFRQYSTHYLATAGQLYYSDAQQFAHYTDGYHTWVDTVTQAQGPSTEMISELYVPRDRLADFMAAVAEDFRANQVNCIYGTIRLVERDDESFLAWATERWACVIFNLCTRHSPEGLERSAEAFRRLIDLAIEHGGKYYLTYHRWARREQVEACYPQFTEFLRQKRRHDPEERFQSDWYRHYRAMFADAL
ncbi:MAG: FAD-dependent oxidoreductase, partial [Gaiellaceae bacterium]